MAISIKTLKKGVHIKKILKKERKEKGCLKNKKKLFKILMRAEIFQPKSWKIKLRRFPRKGKKR